MIVVDTSAIVAITFGEPERELFLRALPLLFKGDVFSQTDIASACNPSG